MIPKKYKYCRIVKELTSVDKELIKTYTTDVVMAVNNAKHNPRK
jgi:hypothetical protein